MSETWTFLPIVILPAGDGEAPHPDGIIGVRGCYRDPDELHELMADGRVRILDSIVL
jgi:hypothetical protein